MKKRQGYKQSGKVTRREFIAGIGAVSVATALQPVWAIAPQSDGQRSNREGFTRIFNLPPFAEPGDAVERALREIGAPAGLMDAKDPLQEGPVNLIINPELSANNPDNLTQTAGLTFLGQFLDHDMTFDTESQLGVATPPEQSTNGRTPKLDLDSLYGRGPTADPQLYDPIDKAKFKVEAGGQFEDVPRGSDGVAIIADPRNDEHMMISGLQAAFLLFHNRVVDQLREDDRKLGSERRSNVFSDARQIVTWHYQWIVVNEFLPHIIGSALVNDILTRGAQFYKPRGGEQRMPVEFQGAAYRFGHSLVRPSYRANLAGDLGKPFFGFIFDPSGEGQSDPVDLRGGARAPRRFIGWQTFFNFGGSYSVDVRPPKVIDTRISTPLFNLPLGAIASGQPPTSLPQRNLLRHLTWSLPSGQAIADAMRIPALSPTQLGELAPYGVGFERSTPLWYYILKEAALGGGNQLAGVGARIVGEVFLTLLRLDQGSYLYQNPAWRPTLPSTTPGTFQMTDFFRFARVDPATRGQ